MSINVRYSRSTSVHEAGHAVVAWSFRVPVGALWVNADDDGGESKIGPTTHLELTEPIAICLAGAVAQEVFNCPGHELAAFHDDIRITELREEHGVSEQAEDRALRVQGWNIAAVTLEAHRTKVNRLADQLVERGRVEASDFLNLING